MHQINSLAEFNQTLIDHKYVVVDFFADWCGPCKAIAPFFKELSHKPEYQNVYFCKVNIDDGEEIASVCDVSSLPTFLFYRNKENVDDVVGANKNELVQKINELTVHTSL